MFWRDYDWTDWVTVIALSVCWVALVLAIGIVWMVSQ
jgi:hypothetical protein